MTDLTKNTLLRMATVHVIVGTWDGTENGARVLIAELQGEVRLRGASVTRAHFQRRMNSADVLEISVTHRGSDASFNVGLFRDRSFGLYIVGHDVVDFREVDHEEMAGLFPAPDTIVVTIHPQGDPRQAALQAARRAEAIFGE